MKKIEFIGFNLSRFVSFISNNGFVLFFLSPVIGHVLSDCSVCLFLKSSQSDTFYIRNCFVWAWERIELFFLGKVVFKERLEMRIAKRMSDYKHVSLEIRFNKILFKECSFHMESNILDEHLMYNVMSQNFYTNKIKMLEILRANQCQFTSTNREC